MQNGNCGRNQSGKISLSSKWRRVALVIAFALPAKFIIGSSLCPLVEDLLTGRGIGTLDRIL